MLSGIKARWAEGRIKYDVRHFMANFSSMVAAEKTSPGYGIFMSYVSAAIFKILPGEHDRVRRHLEGLNMTTESIGRVPRRYWRRMARYTCPEPEVRSAVLSPSVRDCQRAQPCACSCAGDHSRPV